MTARQRPSAPCVVMLVAVAALTMASACGSGRRASVYEPLSPGAGVEGADLASVPKPDGAVALARPAVADTTTTQSLRVLGSSPDNTFGFYERHLPEVGWQPQSAAAKAGHDGWRAVWMRDGRQLDVTVRPDGADEANSQVDLALSR